MANIYGFHSKLMLIYDSIFNDFHHLILLKKIAVNRQHNSNVDTGFEPLYKFQTVDWTETVIFYCVFALYAMNVNVFFVVYKL